MSHPSTSLGVLPDARAESAEACSEAVPSFAEVFESNAAFVWRIVARQGVAQADLPDVCQDVFVAIHRMLPNFRGRSSLTTWIYAICVRTVSRYRRKAFRRREQFPDEPCEETGPAHQQSDLELNEFRRQLDAILHRLSREQREMFILHELEELSIPQAATIAGCPIPTAYSRLHAAREAVLAAFARKGARP